MNTNSVALKTIGNSLLAFIAICSININAAPVRVANSEGALPNTLLAQALDQGATHDLRYVYNNADIDLSTILQGVRDQALDVFWTMTSPEYEQEFLAIRIPIYRGTLGMRLAMVRQDDVNIFAKVKQLKDLKQYTAGQGRLWTDAKILQANGLPVIKELKYRNMFRMLEAERFDYFPRGIQEIWDELEQHPGLNLVAEPNVMLRYKVPYYFFVHKSNVALAEHLTAQLEAMVQDGRYVQLFYQAEEIQQVLKNANLQNRTIIELENPLLTAQTPLDRKVFWFNPREEQTAMR